MGRPLDGRSRSVLVYRLWIREDAVPQEGQEAAGEVVRRVSVISKATSTSSTWTSGRSGMMINGYLSVLENALQKRKNVQLPVYHKGDQQRCVRIRLCEKAHCLMALLRPIATRFMAQKRQDIG